jgi:hypothetical protein
MQQDSGICVGNARWVLRFAIPSRVHLLDYNSPESRLVCPALDAVDEAKIGGIGFVGIGIDSFESPESRGVVELELAPGSVCGLVCAGRANVIGVPRIGGESAVADGAGHCANCDALKNKPPKPHYPSVLQ